MIFFDLKEWKEGINAFFIVLNIQQPRFDSNIQRMIQLINDFFNNPKFWNQTGIIFTRCFADCFEESDREMAETQYKARVVDFIKKLPGCQNISPSMPCFFVDSKAWKEDKSTQDEYIKAFKFAVQFPPVPTNNFKIVNPDYMKEEEEMIPKVLVNYDVKAFNDKKVVTYYYEDKKRKKITGYNGEVVYKEPETIRSYSESEEFPINQPLPPPPIIIHHHKRCQIY